MPRSGPQALEKGFLAWNISQSELLRTDGAGDSAGNAQGAATVMLQRFTSEQRAGL